MAMKQFIPYLPLEHVGGDEGQPIPVFPVAPEVRFKSGADLKPLIAELRLNGRSTVNAAACAGKSVKLPKELTVAGTKLFAHVMPNLNLAWATYDYISKIYAGMVDITFVEDFSVDGFPDTGLVLTSSAVFAMYSTYWRSADIDKGVTLYMDEAQEADCATHVIRTLQTSMPGVSAFIQASATLGNDPSTYRKILTPAGTGDFRYAPTDPPQWDLFESKVPWCVAKTTGDILVFDDDTQHHMDLREKFADAGISTVVLTVDMPLSDFKRIWKTVGSRPKGGPVMAIIADSGYRSGFTFTTVTRIIDTCIVMYRRPDAAGRLTLHTRSAYAWEVYQASGRGGRIAGMPCDYWRPNYEPDTASAMLEGVESDGAAILFRMLGFKPNKMLSTTPFAHKSLVPRNFTRVLAGKTYIRAYKLDTAWPLSGEKFVSPPVSPVTAPSSPREGNDGLISNRSSGQRFLNHKRSFSEGTIDVLSDGYSDRGVTQVDKEEDALGVDVGEHVTSRLPDDWADVFTRATSHIRRGPRGGMVELGKYYDLRELPRGENLMFQTWKQVETAMGDTNPGRFLLSLSRVTRDEVLRVALSTYNGAVTVMTAGTNVVRQVSDAKDLHELYTPAMLEAWVREVHGYCLRGNALAMACLDMLNSGMPGKCVEIPPMVDMEMRTIDKFLANLASRGEALAEPRVPMHTLDQAFDPGATSGRYMVDVEPNDFRSRLALVIMGRGKVPQVNILMQ